VRPALRIAIVGAESTGKTVLAQALAARLAADTGLRVSWVPEWLRLWCQAQGRTPRAQEQPAIARAQHERIDAAAQTHDIVVCDTTALMTAAYSRLVFGDRSLDDTAATLHQDMALTLLTALDLPWVPDPLRDGPRVRAEVDAHLRDLMLSRRLPWALVAGQGEDRVESALAAAGPVLERQTGLAPARRAGLFSRLTRHADDAGDAAAPPAWVCDCCAWPPGEQAELARQAQRRPPRALPDHAGSPG
jgi:nicotinamide riboside kinase